MEEQQVLNREQIEKELDIIAGLSEDGKVYPKKGVMWARQNRDSAIAQQLEWDDATAAEAHREDQFRRLVAIVVKPSAETGKMIRAWVSQPTDRLHGGGYTRVDDSLRKARQELVNEAVAKLKRLRTSYTHLPELDPVFNEIEATVNRFEETRIARMAA